MADKEAESVPFRNVEDIDFLKRGFVKREGKIWGPLNPKSVYKSLCLYLPKGNVTEEVQIAQSMLAGTMEAVAHGEEFFDSFQFKICTLLDKHPNIKPFIHERVYYSYAQWVEWLGTAFDDGTIALSEPVDKNELNLPWEPEYADIMVNLEISYVDIDEMEQFEDEYDSDDSLISYSEEITYDYVTDDSDDTDQEYETMIEQVQTLTIEQPLDKKIGNKTEGRILTNVDVLHWALQHNYYVFSIVNVVLEECAKSVLFLFTPYSYEIFGILEMKQYMSLFWGSEPYIMIMRIPALIMHLCTGKMSFPQAIMFHFLFNVIFCLIIPTYVYSNLSLYNVFKDVYNTKTITVYEQYDKMKKQKVQGSLITLSLNKNYGLRNNFQFSTRTGMRNQSEVSVCAFRMYFLKVLGSKTNKDIQSLANSELVTQIARKTINRASPAKIGETDAPRCVEREPAYLELITEGVVPLSEAQAPTTSSMSENMYTHYMSDDMQLEGCEGYSAKADLDLFLKRKIKLTTITWPIGSLSTGFYPWTLFFSNTAIQDKLANYHLIKGQLMLTFYINGTPFHYGLAMAGFNYLNAARNMTGTPHLTQMTQWPHITLDPTNSRGGCLCLPFFYPYNFLSLNSSSFDTDAMGYINLESLASLAQINGGTDSITITVFGQLKDYELAAPTDAGFALSGEGTLDLVVAQPLSDEYKDTGIISGPANVVAQYAGYLAKAPVIGKFALATKIGAGAVGSIARLFGFSRPVTVEDVRKVRNQPLTDLALTEGEDSSQKLSLTAKQEITIDPSIVDIQEDEMSLDFLFKKSVYLTKFTWDPTTSVGTTIFAIDVNPMCEPMVASTGPLVYTTPLSYIGRCFAQWCGSLKYRFVFPASNFHRGRVSIIFDPVGPISTDPFNTTFNVIVDLAETRDVEVIVKWQSDKVWLEVEDSITVTSHWTTTSPEARTCDTKHANGVLYVQVVNELVVPDATSAITPLVYISAGDDFMYNNPGGAMYNWDIEAEPADGPGSLELVIAKPLSDAVVGDPLEATDEHPQEIDIIAGANVLALERPLITYGESFTHLRQILKRTCFYRRFAHVTTDATACHLYTRFPMRPLPKGFMTLGVDSTLLAKKYNYVGQTMVSWLMQMYAGWRGGIRWKFIQTGDRVYQILLKRRSLESELADSFSYTVNKVDYNNATETKASRARGQAELIGGSFSGMALTHTGTQQGLEIEMPYALPVKFSSTANNFTAANANTMANAFPGGTSMQLQWEAWSQGAYMMDSYVSAAEDFSLVGFVGTPVLRYYATPAAI